MKMTQESPLDQMTVEAQQIFGDLEVRPAPQFMASLISRGLTDQHLVHAWEALGHEVPDTSLMLRELNATLPHIQTVSDTIADGKDDIALRLFAGRDGENLYDDFSIVHGDKHPSSLLPASTPLWEGRPCGRRFFGSGLMERFLDNHGVTRDVARDPHARLEIIDTGFNGSIGIHLSDTVRSLHGRKAALHYSGRLAISLVYANPSGYGNTIASFSSFTSADLPRSYSWLGGDRFEEYSRHSAAGLLATSLQLYPRYVGAYTHLQERGTGEVVAVPRTEEYCVDLDNYWDAGETGANNDSIVNPLAAAIAQRHFVLGALERTGRLHSDVFEDAYRGA